MKHLAEAPGAFFSHQASAENPMVLTKGPQSSVSDLSLAANSAGLEDCATKPIMAMPLTVSGAAKATRMAALRRLMMSVGVLAGT